VTRKIDLGVWYWLDAAPAEEWDQDLRDMRALGYDYVVAGWGGRIDRVRERIEVTRRFLELAGRHGLGVYLCVWSGMVMYPHVGGEAHAQVDNHGQPRSYYNLWDRAWPGRAYREYVQSIAEAYRGCAGLRGYLFDDTFASHSRAPGAGKYVCYTPGDAERFREYLRGRYHDLSVINLFWRDGNYGGWDALEPPREPGQEFWLEWYEARAGWFEEWARETRDFIRERDPRCELYLLDGGGIAANLRPLFGIDLGRLTRYFDVVMLYAMPSGFEKPRVDMAPILSAVDFMVSATRELAPDQRVAFDLHIYQPFTDEDYTRKSDWPNPTLDQIKAITRQAIASGANMVDHYGYRIGNWRLPDKESREIVPEVRTMLRYRRDLWDGLRQFHREIKTEGRP